jgi:leucyl aminopeptidase (aminopeptidase T)
MGSKIGFSVNISKFNATGINNGPLSKETIKTVKRANLVIAITEYSASSSLVEICKAPDTITRCASMPMVEKRMENTSFQADYKKVKKYAIEIENLLNKAIGAEITFSTGDHLYIDLRNRIAESDKGECKKTGQFINFPSGEGCKAPFEGTKEERKKYGESKTKGILPVSNNGKIIKFVIEKNKIVNVIGNSKNAKNMRIFFSENDSRRNIAELGIGCNPKAVVTGNILEDEKVGMHIAYGTSHHLGGKVQSDMHQDICYTKGLPVEGTTLILINKDGTKTKLINNATLQYNLLQ